jgi:serine/threonine protein kinase/thioredoxin-like negative regulator of GroEL
MGIRPEQRDLAQTLFEGARERQPEERASYLANACPNDPELRDCILRMIAFDEKDTEFLEMPILAHILTRPLLEEGDLVEGRFRIIRLVGTGGMGEVYEAVDMELDERVALKTVRRELAGVSDNSARLRSEIQLGRKINHSNVCKIHYFGVDRRPEGDVLFLTMDFLNGQTLADRLRAEGSLRKEDVFSIAAQIAAGLTATHQEGVIHQDLKTNNIMLVPRSDGTTRAVIMDFGIACSHEDDDTVIRPPGTPAYMAPERIGEPGRRPTADIYSFGVILYEMVTGRRPLQPDALRGVRRKLPPAPSTIRRGVGGSWDRAILRCLDPQPEKRFAHPTDVVDALRPVRWWIPAAAAIMVALAAFGVYQRVHNRTAPPSRTLLILPFEVVGGAGPQNGLMDDIAERIQKNPVIRRKWLVFSPAEAREMNVATAAQAKPVFGATHILAGTVTGEEDSVTVAGRLIDVNNPQAVEAFQKTCPLDNSACLQDGLLREIGAVLDPGTFSYTPAPPISSPALPYYLQGMQYLRRDLASYDDAIPFLQQAIARDPSAVQPRVALADAFMLGFRDKRDPAMLTEARRILDQILPAHPNLPELHASFGNLYRLDGHYEAAVRELRLAVNADPSNHVFRNWLGIAFYLSGQDSDAVAEFEKALQLQPRYWPGYIDYAVFHFRRGRFQQAAALLERLIQWAPDHAQGLATLGGVYVDMRRNADAERVSRRSCALKPGRMCYGNLGIALQRQRRTIEAIATFEQALGFGNPSEMLLFNMADTYARLGQRAKALEFFHRAAARIEQSLKVNLRNSGLRAMLAYCLVQTGERERAVFELEQALQSSPEDKNVRKYSVLTYEALGERDKALEALRAVPKQVLEDLESAPGTEALRHDTRYPEIAQEVRNSKEE